jgi:Tfp pilus assembly protein PilX
VRRLTTSQEGVALPVATAMLLVISLFVIAFFSVTLQVNETSIDDRSSKRALAAAEAGLQMALYRMNEIGTSQPTQCFTTNWVPPVSGQCPAAPDGQLGNGATYTYYVTPELGTGLCLGVTGAETDRCITAVGRAGGLQRRVQVRANTLTGTISYKSVGLMSKSLMYGGNSSKITSDMGANGLVHWGNSAETFSNPAADIDGAIYRGPDSPTPEYSGSPKEPVGGWHTVSTPYDFPPIQDFDTVKTTATNITTPSWSRPGMTYTALTKTLRVTSTTGTASLLPGTYYFCRFSMANSAKLTFSTTQPTKIYIDSPSRAGSLCGNPPVSNPSPTYPVGTFWIENSNEFNMGGREELVEVLVEGTSHNGTRSRPSFCTPGGDLPHTDKCESDVILVNSAGFRGMIYAPKTTVELNNSGKMWGAIGADKIRFNNSVEFQLTDAVKDSDPVTAGGIGRGNWVECRPQPDTAGDPESGC